MDLNNVREENYLLSCNVNILGNPKYFCYSDMKGIWWDGKRAMWCQSSLNKSMSVPLDGDDLMVMEATNDSSLVRANVAAALLQPPPPRPPEANQVLALDFLVSTCLSSEDMCCFAL